MPTEEELNDDVTCGANMTISINTMRPLCERIQSIIKKFSSIPNYRHINVLIKESENIDSKLLESYREEGIRREKEDELEEVMKRTKKLDNELRIIYNEIAPLLQKYRELLEKIDGNILSEEYIMGSLNEK